jgi:thioredoxin reductase (NADPH)
MSPIHDLVIIGGGVGGMTAGIFAARYRLKTVILEKAVVGGQPAIAERIENFPGFPEIDGWELSTRLEKHAVELGVGVVEPESVQRVESEGRYLHVIGERGQYRTKALIVASGGQPRLLGVPGEKEFTRKGVHYCAQCAGLGYEGKRIAVVGGGESALLGALYLSKIGREIILIHRREAFRAEKILQERILDCESIKILLDSTVEEITGDKVVGGIKVRDLKTAELFPMDLDAVFVYIGYVPNTDFIDVDKDDRGFLRVNRQMQTSHPGIFACGNVVREDAQIISAMGEGAVAAISAARYVMETDS